MPLKPPTVCCHPGCGNLSQGRFCSAHEEVAEENRKEQYASYDRKRGNSYQRGYDERWRKVSKYYRTMHPICEYQIRCKGALATEVDHVIPLDEGGLKYEWENLKSTCRRCHTAKTWQDKVRQRKKQKI